MTKNSIVIPKGFRVLLIEDSAYRIQWFREHLGEPITVAWTPEMAMEQIRRVDNETGNLPFEIIFLDHDAKWDDSRVTFLEAAKVIAERKFNGGVVIHSMNPIGAKAMQQIIERSESNATVNRLVYGTFGVERA